jgi:hypothetical protein
MRRLALIGIVSASSLGAQQTPPSVFGYGRAVVAPEAIIGSAIAGWIDQSRDDPRQWSRTAGGYGTRVASRFGQAAVQTTVIYTGGALFHVDPGYHLCGCTGFLGRTTHALASPLTVTTEDGATVPSPLKPIGALAGGYAAMGWRPGPYDPVKGYQFAATALAINAGVNLAREWLHISF